MPGHRRSAPAPPPPATAPPPRPEPDGQSTLRVLQWNIHHGGFGTDNVYDHQPHGDLGRRR